MALLTFQELQARYKDNQIPYDELLMTFEWYFKRFEIVQRDGKICSCCNLGPTSYLPNKGYFHYRTQEFREFGFTSYNGQRTHEMFSFFREIPTPSDKFYKLHVHHKYYIKNKQPWEYKNEALITMCNWCHWQFHEENEVSMYVDESLQEELEMTPCKRCNGAGHFPQYDHVDKGRCFRCRGYMYEELIPRTNPK